MKQSKTHSFRRSKKFSFLSFPEIATVVTLEKILLNLDNLCLDVFPSALLCYARSFLRSGSNASRSQKFSIPFI